MAVDAAIVVQLGFTQKAEPNREYGMFALHDWLADVYHDRRKSWLGLRTWNADMQQAADVVLHRAPGRIVHVGFSYGCGEGLLKFAKALRRRARRIDLAVLIDPVTRYRLLKPLSMFSNHRFKLPPNVDEAALWRTVNWPKWTSPWGRDVRETSEQTRVIRRTTFGSNRNLAKYKPGGIHRVNGDVWHSNIDELPEVHRDVLDLLQAKLGSWLGMSEPSPGITWG